LEQSKPVQLLGAFYNGYKYFEFFLHETPALSQFDIEKAKALFELNPEDAISFLDQKYPTKAYFLRQSHLLKVLSLEHEIFSLVLLMQLSHATGQSNIENLLQSPQKIPSQAFLNLDLSPAFFDGLNQKIGELYFNNLNAELGFLRVRALNFQQFLTLGGTLETLFKNYNLNQYGQGGHALYRRSYVLMDALSYLNSPDKNIHWRKLSESYLTSQQRLRHLNYIDQFQSNVFNLYHISFDEFAQTVENGNLAPDEFLKFKALLLSDPFEFLLVSEMAKNYYIARTEGIHLNFYMDYKTKFPYQINTSNGPIVAREAEVQSKIYKAIKNGQFKIPTVHKPSDALGRQIAGRGFIPYSCPSLLKSFNK